MHLTRLQRCVSGSHSGPYPLQVLKQGLSFNFRDLFQTELERDGNASGKFLEFCFVLDKHPLMFYFYYF